MALTVAEDLRWQQELGGEGIDDCFPVRTRCVDSEVAGVFITDDKVSQFVCRSGTPTAGITVQADDRDRDVIVNY